MTLGPLLCPRAIAVIGASSSLDKLGGRALQALVAFGARATLYPVNPRETQILGLTTYPRVLDIPGPVDRAIITVPAEQVATVLDDCIAKGVRVAQVYSGGFGETGPRGRQLEQALVARARAGGLRIVGPNCLGTYCPESRLTFMPDVPDEPGEVAIISQSGGLSVDLLSQGAAAGLRFRAVVSVGNCIDLDIPDFLDHFRADPQTRLIGIYLESVRDGARFREALAAATATKPVVILKGGRGEQGSRTVASHTGALAGREGVWQAVFRQGGALSVDSAEELLAVLAALPVGPLLGDRREVILVGNGGGATVVASDLCDRLGLRLAPAPAETLERLRAAGLPPGATLGNPTDVPASILWRSRGRLLAQAIEALTSRPEPAPLIVHLNLTPFRAYPGPETFVEDVVTAALTARRGRAPLLLSLRATPDGHGEALRRHAQRLAQDRGVPVFPSLNLAIVGLAKTMEDAARRRARCAGAADPARLAHAGQPGPDSRGTALSETEGRDMLAAWGLRLPRMVLTRNLEEALEAARSMAYPVVLKVQSPQILHKTDTGAVLVGITGPERLSEGYARVLANARRAAPQATIEGVVVAEEIRGEAEFIVGLSRDALFGPVLLLGLGGVWVELLRDVVLRVLPVDRDEIRRMLSELKAAPLLAGYRGRPPLDMEALVDLVARVVALGEADAGLRELDLNPVVVGLEGCGAVAVDVRLVRDPAVPVPAAATHPVPLGRDPRGETPSC